MIDRGVLDELAATTDPEFVGELIDAYLEESPALIAKMSATAEVGQADEFTRAAHSLKSSSASVGASELSEMARALEARGKAGHIEGLSSELDILQTLFARTQTALQEYQSG